MTTSGDGEGTGVVSLPMYDLASVRTATDSLWQGLRHYLGEAGIEGLPETLNRVEDCHAHWLSPDLLLSQACGYPLTHQLAGKVRYVATPHYDFPGCAGPVYRSALVCRMGDPRAVTGLASFAGCRAAINGFDSQSGYLALAASVHPVSEPGSPFFRSCVETGTHLNSLEAVREGRADLCAVDCVTYGLIQRYDAEVLAGLSFLCWSLAAPGLPMITSIQCTDDGLERLRAGLTAGLEAPDLADCRARLGITGISVLSDRAYDAIPALETRIGPINLGLSR